MVDAMPFPAVGVYNTQETHFWLAELSARRLLNRVHHTMYRSDQQQNHSPDDSLRERSLLRTMLKVSYELDRQLDDWFALLPHMIKPNEEKSSQWSAGELNILHRFHSTKDIILRPFLLYTCNIAPGQEISPEILTRCANCLSNCRAYLDVSMRRLLTPSSCREIILHSYVPILS